MSHIILCGDSSTFHHVLQRNAQRHDVFSDVPPVSWWTHKLRVTTFGSIIAIHLHLQMRRRKEAESKCEEERTEGDGVGLLLSAPDEQR